MDIITIDFAKKVRHVDPYIIGINANFLTDHAEIRQAGQGYEAALRKLGVKSLRYPGGEKSDEFFWSEPPWDKPRPKIILNGPKGRLAPMTDYIENLSTFKFKPFDFDEFIAVCRNLDAEPIICMNFDSMYLPPVSDKGIAPTKAQLLEHAVEWVRYSNIRKGYGVRYWELGNESYLQAANGGAKAEDYARDFKEIATAMKAVDPSILIGANGPGKKDEIGHADGENGPIWWQTLFEKASADIDFLVVHPYPCWKWGSYDYYTKNNNDFTFAVNQAVEALEEWAIPKDARRIRVFSTELNAADWAASDHYPDLDGWPLVNDLGHALVLFEIIGQHLLHPKVDMAQVWNTRWVSPTEKQLWNTLDENNKFNATGYAISIWGQNIQTNMVEAIGSENVRSYASGSSESGLLSVFLINKMYNTREVSLNLKNYSPSWIGKWSILQGQDPEDDNPIYSPQMDITCHGGNKHVSLPPVSISVLVIQPDN